MADAIVYEILFVGPLGDGHLRTRPGTHRIPSDAITMAVYTRSKHFRRDPESLQVTTYSIPLQEWLCLEAPRSDQDRSWTLPQSLYAPIRCFFSSVVKREVFVHFPSVLKADVTRISEGVENTVARIRFSGCLKWEQQIGNRGIEDVYISSVTAALEGMLDVDTIKHAVVSMSVVFTGVYRHTLRHARLTPWVRRRLAGDGRYETACWKFVTPDLHKNAS